MKDKGRKTNRLRIIGGEWRGRWIEFADTEQLRPSKDIVRETVFNWLQPYLPGSRCLDAFAGSGVLGFEARSRAAAEVILLDSDSEVIRQLELQRDQLNATGIDIVHVTAQRYLQQAGKPFDIVFLDPPFHSGLLQQVCVLLLQYWLKPGSRVYVEAARDEGLPELPVGLAWIRQKHSGDVVYGLAEAWGL